MKNQAIKTSKKNKKFDLNWGRKNYQILTNDDVVCIPSLSSIFLAVLKADTYLSHTLEKIDKLHGF